MYSRGGHIALTWMILIGLVVALCPERARSGERPHASEQQESRPGASAVVISWTTYGNREDFVVVPKRVHELFCNVRHRFGVIKSLSLGPDIPFERQSDRKKSIPSGTPASFMDAMREALTLLRDVDSPELILVLNSHAATGLLGTQHFGTLALIKLVDAIFDEIERFPAKKRLRVRIQYDACFSGSIVPVLMERVPSEKASGYRVDVIASTSACRASHGDVNEGSLLLKTERLLVENMATGERSPWDCSIFLEGLRSLGGEAIRKDEPVEWSNYRDLDNELSLPMLSGLLTHHDSGLKERALVRLRDWGPLAAEASPQVVASLDDPDPKIAHLAEETWRALRSATMIEDCEVEPWHALYLAAGPKGKKVLIGDILLALKRKTLTMKCVPSLFFTELSQLPEEDVFALVRELFPVTESSSNCGNLCDLALDPDKSIPWQLRLAALRWSGKRKVPKKLALSILTEARKHGGASEDHALREIERRQPELRSRSLRDQVMSSVLNSSIPIVREQAAKTLLAMGPLSAAERAQLRKSLKYRNGGSRLSLVYAMGKVGHLGSNMASDLMKALNDKDPEVRLEAVSALGSIDKNPSQIIGALRKARQDPDPSVSEAARGEFERYSLRHPKSIRSLVAAIRSAPNERKGEMIRSLKLWTTEPAVQTLLKDLAGPENDDKIRREALALLIPTLRHPSDLPTLVSILNMDIHVERDGGKLQRQALEALAAIPIGDDKALEEEIWKLLIVYILDLGVEPLGAGAFDVVLSRYGRDQWKRVGEAVTKGREAKEIPPGQFLELVKRFDSGLRAKAGDALWSVVNDPSAKVEEVREALSLVWGTRPNKKVYSTRLLLALSSVKSISSRAAIVDALGNSEMASVIPALLALHKNPLQADKVPVELDMDDLNPWTDQVEELQSRITAALQKITNSSAEAAVPFLQTGLLDKSHLHTRKVVVSLLAGLGARASEATDSLRAAALGDGNVWVRKLAVDALRSIAMGKGPNRKLARKTLAEVATRDADGWVKESAGSF